MRRLTALAAAVLAVYSAWLIQLEVTTSQATVDLYLTDIEGPVRFYAANTTLSVALLWGAGLLFAVCLLVRAEPRPWTSRAGRFYLSQVGLFAYLGVDDRFLIHEAIGVRTGIEDALLLMALGVAELVVLWLHRDVWDRPATRRWLLTAGALFGVMGLIDLLGPDEMLLRLTFEDLAKTWGGFALFLFAWHNVVAQLDAVRGSAPAARAVEPIAS